ncbi:MAG: DUF1684 domain-containing protein [Vicinamibacterales bacterium]
MKPVLFSAAFVLLGLTACRPPDPMDEGDYTARITAIRAAKDAEFMSTNDPVPESRKEELLPLPYYDIDPTYAVPAVLRPSENSPTMMMVTSTGSQEEMRRVGQLEFTLHGKPLKLTAFVSAASADINRLFVPFSDATSGTETYPAGRYLDLDRRNTGIYEVDFNLAYNPYCHYNLAYVCPLPPAENRLDVRIEAGERIHPQG